MKTDDLPRHDPLVDVIVLVVWLAVLIATFSYW